MQIKVIGASEMERDPVRELAWGDYWLRRDIENAFRTLGHTVTEDVTAADAILYLFGFPAEMLGYGELPADCFKAVWIHSHPDLVTPPELARFDKVYSQSPHFRERLVRWGWDARTIMGATAKKPVEQECQYDIVFVGNARPGLRYGRPIIRDLGDQPWNIRLWGQMWEQRIPERYLAGDYYPNEQLGQLYGSARVVLNDHHPDMAREGFVNFRIFDALASGAFVISDRSDTIAQVFGHAVPQYEQPAELIQLLTHFLSNEEHRSELVRLGQEVALAHTFEGLCRTFLDDAEAHST